MTVGNYNHESNESHERRDRIPDAPKESAEELVTIVKELPTSKRQARKTLAQQPMLLGMEDDQ